MLTVAQLSDIHLDGRKRAFRRLRRIVKYLARLPHQVDAVIVSGDIADSGSLREYAQAAKLLARLEPPVIYIPGNHDSRSAMRESGLAAPGDGPINCAFRSKTLVVLALDSLVTGESHGELDPQTLQWLRTELAATSPEDRVLIALHHPPRELYSPLVQERGLRNPGELAEIVRAHPNIAAVMCGHAHVATLTTFAGLPLVCAPSTSFILGPVWEGDLRVADPVVDYGAPPGIAFHSIDDNGEYLAHFRNINKRRAAHGRGYRRDHQDHPPGD